MKVVQFVCLLLMTSSILKGDRESWPLIYPQSKNDKYHCKIWISSKLTRSEMENSMIYKKMSTGRVGKKLFSTNIESNDKYLTVYDLILLIASKCDVPVMVDINLIKEMKKYSVSWNKSAPAGVVLKASFLLSESEVINRSDIRVNNKCLLIRRRSLKY